MSDLLDTLPDFDTKPYTHLLHSLEKNDITTTDLITLDPVEIARKCPLPLLDLRRLANNVIEALQKDLNMTPPKHSTSSNLLPPTSNNKPSSDGPSFRPSSELLSFVKSLDPAIDKALGGGFPRGYISELAGESSVGKTQFLFGLLLSVQVPSPFGPGKSAIYLSTEDKLSTKRLQEILATHPFYAQLPVKDLPKFDKIHFMAVNNIESQQQVIEFQLPVAVKRFDIGLVVVDSVAANFRADRETITKNGIVDRAADLNRLGLLLRRIAIEHDVAVVVANQVSDRFADNIVNLESETLQSSSPATTSTTASQGSSVSASLLAERNNKLSLDHQQRFFTGWGDRSATANENLKTPALGLAWANQISARVVLKVEGEDSGFIETATGAKRRRFMSLVFAPWTAPTARPVEYSIEAQGLVSIEAPKKTGDEAEHLDECDWEDEEYP